MLQKFTVIFLLLLMIALSFGNILFQENQDSLVITGKYVQLEIGKDGNLRWVSHLFGRAVAFYKYDKDGFDVSILNAEREIPFETPTFNVEFGPEKKNGSYEFIKVIFEYPNGSQKVYVFDESLVTYQFKVLVKSADPSAKQKVTLPLIWSSDTVRYGGNIFISYRPDKDYVVIVKFDGQLAKTGVPSVSGSSIELDVFMGPYKRMLLKHIYGPESDKIFTLLKTIPGVGTWYSFISDSLSEFFNWLNLLTRNFGLTIILFTIIIRLVLYPFYHAQTKQMIQMRKLQPAIEAIKKKYKEPQKQQEELMKLYKENNINPSSGCLMLLIQLPIFMLLYGVIQSYQELFSVSGRFLIWKDLSAGGWSENWLFLILTILTSYYLALITSQDTRSAWQQIIIGAVFPFFFINLPSGIFLYWTMNSIIQLAITFYIYKRYKIKGLTHYELWGVKPKKRG